MSSLDTVVPVELLEKEPRFYQSGAAEQTAEYLQQGFRRIIVKGPTGCGKTFMSKLVAVSKAVREATGITEGKIRLLYIANKHRLNRQAEEEYASIKDYVELIPQSAFSSIPPELVEKGWDMTFIDECHHEAMDSIQQLLTNLIDKPIIGFTADDNRGDGLLLKFDRVVTSITEKDAADHGFIEKAGINTVLDTGKQNKTELLCELLDSYHSHMGNTIIFLKTEAEVRAVYRHIRYRLKIPVGMLNKDSNERDLDNSLDKLSSGEIQFLVNCQKIGEGVDTPNVTDVILARKFNSRPEKKQYVGRAIRPDSPCGVWEFMNPLEECVCAKEVVGGVKYERLIWQRNGEWNENLVYGEDPTWGKMGEYRHYNLRALTMLGMKDGLKLIPDNHIEHNEGKENLELSSDERDNESLPSNENKAQTQLKDSGKGLEERSDSGFMQLSMFG